MGVRPAVTVAQRVQTDVCCNFTTRAPVTLSAMHSEIQLYCGADSLPITKKSHLIFSKAVRGLNVWNMYLRRDAINAQKT